MHGVGVHQWDIPVSSLSPLFLKKLYATQIILPPTFMMIKLSLLMLYLHIFYPKVILRYCIYAGMIINSLFYTGCLGAAAASWTPSSGEPWFETSFSSAYRTSITLGIVQSVFNVVSDLYLLFLPLWGVSQLQLSFKKKIGVSAIFMTGVLACLSSILTLVFRIKLVANPDTTWDLAAVYTLSIVETTVGIMCSCMPALASFVRLHTPLFHSFLSLFNSSFRRSSMGRNSSSTGYLGESRGLEDMHSSQKDLKPKGKSDGVRVTETPVSPWEEVGVKDEWLTARDMESARSL
ncbi:hypothetical protein MMC13_000083 [Lambiella insularis]|nr:hypothetical protein [Lambiella insularis]